MNQLVCNATLWNLSIVYSVHSISCSILVRNSTISHSRVAKVSSYYIFILHIRTAYYSSNRFDRHTTYSKILLVPPIYSKAKETGHNWERIHLFVWRSRVGTPQQMSEYQSTILADDRIPIYDTDATCVRKYVSPKIEDRWRKHESVVRGTSIVLAWITWAATIYEPTIQKLGYNLCLLLVVRRIK